MKFSFSHTEFILVLVIASLFLFSLVPITQRILRKKEEQPSLLSIGYGVVGFLAAGTFLLVLEGVRGYMFSKALVFDGISVAAGGVILIFAAVALFLLGENIATKTDRFAEKVFLVLNSVIGMLVMIWSNDLIIMFIGLEIMSLALYVLISLSKEETLSKEAAFKYFVLGSFASAIFLMGIAYIFGTTKTTMLSDLAVLGPQILAVNKLFYVGIVLLFLGLCFKVSIFPLHAWTPDVYQGSATPVTAFMAATVKLTSFVAFFRVVNAISGADGNVYYIYMLEWLAVLTMVVGNACALMQDNIKRMLAYSSVAHSGYVMMALITVGVNNQSPEAATAMMFYLYSYAIMTVGSFSILSLLESHEGKSISIDDLKGLASRHPYFALMFTVILLSLAGIPPTLGFFSKLYVFSAALSQDLYWLVIWGALSSAIGVYYYLRPIVYMYMMEGRSIIMPRQMITKVIVMIFAITIMVFGLFSSPLYRTVERTVRAVATVQ